ncbi:MAG: hypothetical protein U0271_16050 [Polyangiaceae bacterium]
MTTSTITNIAQVRGELDRGGSPHAVLATHNLTQEKWAQLEEHTLSEIADAIDRGDPGPLAAYRSSYEAALGAVPPAPKPPASKPTSAEQAVEPAGFEPALPEPVAPMPVSRPNAPPENLTGEVDLSTFRAAMLPFVASSSASPPAIPPINPTPQPPARLPDADATAEVDLRAIVASLPFRGSQPAQCDPPPRVAPLRDAADVTAEVSLFATQKPALPFDAAIDDTEPHELDPGATSQVNLVEPTRPVALLPSLREYAQVVVDLERRPRATVLSERGLTEADWAGVSRAYAAKLSESAPLRALYEELRARAAKKGD